MSFYKSCFINFVHTINSIALTKVNHKKDLVIPFDRQLYFKLHIQTVVSEANRILGFIIRLGRNIRAVPALESLFFAFVKAKLKYCDIVWNTHTLNYVQVLESCQRKYVKFLHLKSTGNYPVWGTDQRFLLSEFNLNALADRHRLHRTIYLLKILHNVINSPFLLSRVPLAVP